MSDGGAERGDEADERLRVLIHDLRTPLTLVLGFAGLLRSRADDLSPDERADHIQRIDDAAKDIKRILDAQ